MNTYVTILHGFNETVDLIELCRNIKADLKIHGDVIYTIQYGFTLKFQNDHRVDIRDWLFATGVVNPKDGCVTTHGY